MKTINLKTVKFHAKVYVIFAMMLAVMALILFSAFEKKEEKEIVQQLAEITNIGYTLGGRITMDLFNGGQNRSAIKVAKLEKDAIQLEKQQLEDRLVTDAVTQVNRITILEDQLGRERLNLGTFQEAFTRTEERFKNGRATNLDVRDAQTALLNAQISVAELQADLMIAHISLRNLIGKI